MFYTDQEIEDIKAIAHEEWYFACLTQYWLWNNEDIKK
jgi:hypothetical protein